MKGDVGGVPPPVKSTASGTGAVKLPVAVTGVPDAAAWHPTCFLCQIQFGSMEELREHEETSAFHRKNLASDVTRRLPPGVGNLRGPSASYVSGRRGAARPSGIVKEEHGEVRVVAASASGGGVGTGTLDDPVCLCGNVDGAATADASSSTTGVKGSTHADDAAGAMDEEADDNCTVSIERESSAWDRLGERFELATSAGRYIDLTDDSAGGGGGSGDDPASSSTAAVKLSASDAAAAFASVGAPVDPATMCGGPPPTTTTPPRSHSARQPSNLRGPLRRLSNMITETIVALREVRLMLQEELQTRERRSQVAEERNAKRRRCRRRGELQSAVVGMNDRTKNIASFVQRHEGAVADCRVTMGRLEELNLLVMKANTLIAAVNGKKATNLNSTSKSK